MSLEFLEEVINKDEQQRVSREIRDEGGSAESVLGRDSLCKGPKTTEDIAGCTIDCMRTGM